MKMATGCLRKIEKINICMKLAKIAFLVTNENMGLCLYIQNLKFTCSSTSIKFFPGFHGRGWS